MIPSEVAVPTYRRADRIAELALATLAAGGIAPGRVTLFVHAHDDVEAYRVLAADRGHRLAVTTGKGVTAQRRAIAEHYSADTPVTVLDDDVTRLARATPEGQLEAVTDLDGWFAHAHATTAANDLWGWGVSAVANPFYLHPGRVTDGLRFAIGTLYGFRSRPGHPVHDLTVEVKEDYEWSLRSWWWDGGLIRFGDTAVVADHYRLPGGCVDTRTPEVSERAAAALIEQWPGLVRRNTRRKGDHAEILLATKKRHLGHPRSTPPPGTPPSRG